MLILLQIYIIRKYIDHIRIIVHMDISFIILIYTLYFVLSFIKLLVLCRTNLLPVNFAYVKATFIMCRLNLCCHCIVGPMPNCYQC